MYLVYGSHTHAQGEVAIQVAKRAVYTDRGTPRGVRETWTISGVLRDTTQGGLTTQVASLQSAYSTNNLFTGLYQDNGSLSHLYLDPAYATGGIRVVDLDFPEGGGKGEYANARHYRIVLEADFPDSSDKLVFYQETLSFVGTGGPRYAYGETLYGTPVRQVVCENTLCYATQQGSAIGLYSAPTPPAPLFPYYEDESQRQVNYTGGQLHGSVYTDFGVQWSYRFTSDVPLSGTPRTL